jgi:hypothetical protein
MLIKIIKSYRNVVVLADKDLIGKKFYEGDMQLDVKESFYKGEELSKEEIIEILKDMKIEDATFNIVGEKSVNLALENEIISEEQIGEVEGIKFALILM